MLGVNELSLKGYPHASISSRGAFEWTLQKIVRNNTTSFKILFLHVQVPDKDGRSAYFLIRHDETEECLLLVNERGNWTRQSDQNCK